MIRVTSLNIINQSLNRLGVEFLKVECSVLSVLFSKNLQKLQYSHKTAASILLRACKPEHITPILYNLHWTSITYSIHDNRLFSLPINALAELHLII